MNRKFFIFIALLTVAVFFIRYRMPGNFIWKETYAHADKQPFGCYVFDSLLSQTMPRGYTVIAQTPWQLAHDSLGKRSLIVRSAVKPDTENFDSLMLQLTRQGWHIIVVYDRMSWPLADSLDIKLEFLRSFNIDDIVQDSLATGNVCWTATDDHYADSCTWKMRPQLITRVVSNHPKGMLTLADYREGNEQHGKPIAVSFQMGEGELILLTAPLLFTNYGILNSQCRPIVLRLLDRLKSMPVTRIDPTFNVTMRNNETPLIVFLEHPPLRLAIYLAIAALLLFFIFTARRRQRIIPVVTTLPNNNMQFVKLIGTLYYQRHDHHDLLRKKMAYSTETIRRLAGIDIEHEDDAPERLAQRTGMTAAMLRERLDAIRHYCNSDEKLSEKQLRECIEHLNEITRNIS